MSGANAFRQTRGSLKGRKAIPSSNTGSVNQDFGCSSPRFAATFGFTINLLLHAKHTSEFATATGVSEGGYRRGRN